MKIIFGRNYQVTDFEGNILPGVFKPFKIVCSRGTQWYICIGPAGGHIHIKKSEFVKEVSA